MRFSSFKLIGLKVQNLFHRLGFFSFFVQVKAHTFELIYDEALSNLRRLVVGYYSETDALYHLMTSVISHSWRLNMHDNKPLLEWGGGGQSLLHILRHVG